MISRNGKAVAGFALAAGDPYARAASDLADMQATAKYADTLDYVGAVKTYQTAGANGVAVLEPEIDAAGAPQATTPRTQHAQMLNDKLASIAKTTSATATDAANAREIFDSMLDDYLTAIQDGRAAQSVGKPLSPLWQRIATSVGIVVIGVGGVVLLLRAGPQHPAPVRGKA